VGPPTENKESISTVLIERGNTTKVNRPVKSIGHSSDRAQLHCGCVRADCRGLREKKNKEKEVPKKDIVKPDKNSAYLANALPKKEVRQENNIYVLDERPELTASKRLSAG